MESMVKRILVIGGTGFIGSNLIRALIKEGYEVSVIVRPDSINGIKRIKDLENLNVIYSTLKDFRYLEYVNKFDLCVNLASFGVNYAEQDIKKIVDGNIDITIDIINLLSNLNIECFINTGSCFEYDISGKEKINEDNLLKPFSLYGGAKAAAEIIAEVYAKKNNIKLVTVRPFGVFGPDEDFHKLVPKLIISGIKDNKVELTSGQQVRDYLYVEDLTNAYLRIIRSDNLKENDVYNVCSAKGISIKELTERIIELCNFDKNNFIFGKKKYRKDEPMYIVGDNSKIKRELNWQVKYGVDEGIKKTYLWYKNYLR